MKRNGKFITVVALAVAFSTYLNVAMAGTPRIAPPNSNAHGKSLTEWLTVYWSWYYGGADAAESQVDGVQLLPIPAGEYISGAGTPEDPALYRGSLQITNLAGTPFVLPLFAWVGERYQGWPAVPDDQPVPDDVLLANVHPELTIDGKTVVSDENKAAFYIPPTSFDPIVTYPTPTSYGSIAAVFFQGEGILSPPLPVGTHVIHLYEPFVIPASVYPPPWTGVGVIYDNTWTITVVPR